MLGLNKEYKHESRLRAVALRFYTLHSKGHLPKLRAGLLQCRTMHERATMGSSTSTRNTNPLP